MEDEAPVIYGLELQARTLAAQTAETECVRFFVGTQSLKCDNQVHLLQYDEENNVMTKTVLLHPAGEVWHMSASPTDPNLLSTCYNHITQDSKCEMGSAIWRLPAASQLNDPSPTDDNTLAFPALEEVVKFDTSQYGTDVKSQIWNPSDGKQVLSVVDNHFLLWDLQNGSAGKLKASATVDLKGKPKVTAASWNPHQNCTTIAAAVDNTVRGWDLRTMQQAWLIDNAHGQMVRELDFNPNRQYYIATCGDDCQAKFWDIRNSKESVLRVTLSDHSHWVWSVRYNHFHDQLVLTSSSDSRVILTRVITISSEPFGHLVEDEEIGDDAEQEKKMQQDGVIGMYEEHEDSVYAVEWSSAEPWIFASLSYDGRLVINKVPRTEKYKILL